MKTGVYSDMNIYLLICLSIFQDMEEEEEKEEKEIERRIETIQEEILRQTNFGDVLFGSRLSNL